MAKMRPCDCKCEDDLKKLDHHGIATNGECIEVIGNHVKIKVYRTEIIVCVSQFKQWAEWFLADQYDKEYMLDKGEGTKRDDLYPKLYSYLCTMPGITDEERSRCLKDFMHANEEYAEMEDIADLMDSFKWSHMPTGETFWSGIHRKVSEYERNKNNAFR